MTFTAGRACGPRTWRRPTWTRREGTSPGGDGVAVGTVQVGIGTPGLTPIRSFQETEFFTVPFAWGFYSPWLVYEAPYFAYRYPFGHGPYHLHFGGYRPLSTPRDHPPGSAALSRGAFGGPGGGFGSRSGGFGASGGFGRGASVAQGGFDGGRH